MCKRVSSIWEKHLADVELDPFSLQNGLKYLWHSFNTVLETFLRDFGPYWCDSITPLLKICWLYIHDLMFIRIPKVLCWIHYRELIVIVKKAVWNDLRSATGLKQASVDGYTVVTMVSNYAQVGQAMVFLLLSNFSEPMQSRASVSCF